MDYFGDAGVAASGGAAGPTAGSASPVATSASASARSAEIARSLRAASGSPRCNVEDFSSRRAEIPRVSQPTGRMGIVKEGRAPRIHLRQKIGDPSSSLALERLADRRVCGHSIHRRREQRFPRLGLVPCRGAAGVGQGDHVGLDSMPGDPPELAHDVDERALVAEDLLDGEGAYREDQRRLADRHFGGDEGLAAGDLVG